MKSLTQAEAIKMQIKGHRKRKHKKWAKYILHHHKGHCPYCHKPIKNIEAHIDEKHENEKPKKIKEA